MEAQNENVKPQYGEHRVKNYHAMWIEYNLPKIGASNSEAKKESRDLSTYEKYGTASGTFRFPHILPLTTTSPLLLKAGSGFSTTK